MIPSSSIYNGQEHTKNISFKNIAVRKNANSQAKQINTLNRFNVPVLANASANHPTAVLFCNNSILGPGAQPGHHFYAFLNGRFINIKSGSVYARSNASFRIRHAQTVKASGYDL